MAWSVGQLFGQLKLLIEEHKQDIHEQREIAADVSFKYLHFLYIPCKKHFKNHYINNHSLADRICGTMSGEVNAILSNYLEN